MKPTLVLDLIEAFRRSKTMFAAVQMGVFEGNRDLGAAGDRLLEGCASLGLLERTADGGYVNTAEADAYLRKDSPLTLTGYILYSNKALYPMWGNLEDAVREGSNQWGQTFGFTGGGPLFSHFFETEEKKQDFLMGMHGFGQLSSPTLVRSFDLSRFRRCVDLGGATGHLVMAAVEAYPEMQGVLFDLPAAIEFGKRFAEGKVELVAGDFFADPLPPGDLYCLGRILHDWNEDKIRLLLRRVVDALPDGGALLIAEKLLRPDNVPAHMQSLNMLICTEGRERSLEEYRVLLTEAGFRSVEGKVTGCPVDGILAVK
jgi:acetylserotonin N-methyltransferase